MNFNNSSNSARNVDKYGRPRMWHGPFTDRGEVVKQAMRKNGHFRQLLDRYVEIDTSQWQGTSGVDVARDILGRVVEVVQMKPDPSEKEIATADRAAKYMGIIGVNNTSNITPPVAPIE